MYDKELQEEFNFTYYLEKLLPQVRDTENVDLTNKLRLEFYKLEKTFTGSISLNPTSDDKTLVNPKSIKPQEKKEEEEETLEILIERVNERFKGIFNEGDRVIVETIFERCKKDEKLRKQAKNNDEQMFNQSIFPEIFEKVAQECYMESMNSFAKLFKDKNFYQSIMQEIARVTYRELHD